MPQAYQHGLVDLADSAGEDWFIANHPGEGIVWTCFRRCGDRLPTQGWKLHVSATLDDAERLLTDVLSFLIGEGATFKLPADVGGIAYLNSGNAGRTQVGKIVTVYPRDHRAGVRLANALHRRWTSPGAPVVRGDIRIAEGSSIYARFGAFGGGPVVADRHGRLHFALRDPSGLLTPDIRKEITAPPAWAPRLIDHLPDEAPTAGGLPAPLAGRYLPLARLVDTGKGTLYLGVDVGDGSTVVIKKVDNGVAPDFAGSDAVSRLEREYHMLQRVSGTCVAPRPLHFDRHAGGATLVMEFIDGQDFSSGIVPTQAALRALAKSVDRIHADGFVHGDLKFANTIVAAGTAILLDFELAAPAREPARHGSGTVGYMPPDDVATSPTVGDYFAFGSCIGHAELGVDVGLLPPPSLRVIGLLNAIGRPRSAAAVASLYRHPADAFPSLSAAMDSIEIAPPRRTAAARPRISHWMRRASLDAGEATRGYVRDTPEGPAWGNRHFEAEFVCGGLNIGAAGIVLGLATIGTALRTDRFDDHIDMGARWLTKAAMPSAGLFTGGIGAALALGIAGGRLGRRDYLDAAARRLREAAANLPAVDLFIGCAGHVWAGCNLHQIDPAGPWLDIVEASASRLRCEASRRNGIICWPDADGAFQLGAAHGSAGIAAALAVWGTTTGDQQATTLALETFHAIHAYGRTGSADTLRHSIGNGSAATSRNHWCHGPAGYLWSMIGSVSDHPELRTGIDWAAEAFLESSTLSTATYCHGLAGQLELCGMLAAIPRFRERAQELQRRTLTLLRLLSIRHGGRICWSAERPTVVTPDLWVGFLGPAAAIALTLADASDSILSARWSARVASGRHTRHARAA